MDFYLFNWTWFSHGEGGDCQIEEGASHGFKRASFEVLDKFDGLKGSDAACGGRQCGHDPPCLQFDCDPVHFLKSVVLGPEVGHGINQVDVPVLVVVFLEILRLGLNCFPILLYLIDQFEELVEEEGLVLLLLLFVDFNWVLLLILLCAFLIFIDFLGHFLGEAVRGHEGVYFHHSSCLGNFLSLGSLPEVLGEGDVVDLGDEHRIG